MKKIVVFIIFAFVSLILTLRIHGFAYMHGVSFGFDILFGWECCNDITYGILFLTMGCPDNSGPNPPVMCPCASNPIAIMLNFLFYFSLLIILRKFYQKIVSKYPLREHKLKDH